LPESTAAKVAVEKDAKSITPRARAKTFFILFLR